MSARIKQLTLTPFSVSVSVSASIPASGRPMHETANAPLPGWRNKFPVKYVLTALGLALPLTLQAAPITTDFVSFSVSDSPLWNDGFPRTASFDVVLANTGLTTHKIGSIGTTTIANPNYAQQIAACGLFDPDCVANVRAFIQVAHGAELTLGGRVNASLGGNISLLSNTASVDYSAMVDVHLSNPLGKPGETNRLSLHSRDEQGNISTRFAALEANIHADADIMHSVSLRVIDRGEVIVNSSESITNPVKHHDILDVQIDGDTGAVLTAFGIDVVSADLENPLTKSVNVDVPAAVDPTDTVRIPLGDVSVYMPDFNLQAFDTSVLIPDAPYSASPHLWNELEIGDRTVIGTLFGGESGALPFDFAKVDINGNVWCPPCAVGSIAVEAPAPVPGTPTPAGMEIRPASTDLGAFLGLGQSALFNPNLLAEITFSQSVEIIDPVLGRYHTNVLTRPVDGSDLLFEIPDGDLDISISYSLADNYFYDFLDLYVSPARTLTTLGVNIYGWSPALQPIRGSHSVFTDVLPFGDPRNIKTLFTAETTLDGFGIQQGSLLSFRNTDDGSAPVRPVSEPGILSLFLTVLAGLLIRSGVRRVSDKPLVSLPERQSALWSTIRSNEVRQKTR